MYISFCISQGFQVNKTLNEKETGHNYKKIWLTPQFFFMAVTVKNYSKMMKAITASNV